MDDYPEKSIFTDPEIKCEDCGFLDNRIGVQVKCFLFDKTPLRYQINPNGTYQLRSCPHCYQAKAEIRELLSLRFNEGVEKGLNGDSAAY